LLARRRSVYEQAVILSVILGMLAGLSVALLLWQWLAARRFPLHQRSADLRIGANQVLAKADEPNRSSAFQPAVTVLKPLKGCDAETENCLRSWFMQQYTGAVQLLFGVASADDPACGVVGKLIAQFRDADAQLIVCDTSLGANAKVCKLAQLTKLAKHGVLVVSDADVRVPPDFLGNAVGLVARASRPFDSAAAFSSEPNRTGGDACATTRAGLVNCFYRLANPTTLAMHWEAIAINADFWSQVLQSKSLKPLDFALGAVMITRREYLDEAGGFESLANCLADDYQLGNRIARNGHRIALCPVVAECWHSPQGWRAIWKHQLRWARTIRVCQPAPYFFSLLSNPTLWPLLWVLFAPAGYSLAVFVAALGLRLLTALDLQHRLTQSFRHVPFLWLAPIKDLLQMLIWLGAFAGNRIEWRGRKFVLRRDGTLAPVSQRRAETST